MAREERRLTVELTTARELTDDEAERDRRADRAGGGPQVEATRSVDPDLVGGIVLQAGSHARRRERARPASNDFDTNSSEELGDADCEAAP